MLDAAIESRHPAAAAGELFSSCASAAGASPAFSAFVVGVFGVFVVVVVVACVCGVCSPERLAGRSDDDAEDERDDDESAELWEFSEQWLVCRCGGGGCGSGCGLVRAPWRPSGLAAPQLGAPAISTGTRTRTHARGSTRWSAHASLATGLAAHSTTKKIESKKKKKKQKAKSKPKRSPFDWRGSAASSHFWRLPWLNCFSGCIQGMIFLLWGGAERRRCAWVFDAWFKVQEKGAEVREPQTAQNHALKWDKMCVSIRATRGNAHVEESQNAVAFVESQLSAGHRAWHFSHPS